MKAYSLQRQPIGLRSSSVDALASLIGGLKKVVGERLTRDFRKSVPAVLIHRALEDAAELARTTDFPHLFFPALAEEKVRLVSAALGECDAPQLLRSAA